MRAQAAWNVITHIAAAATAEEPVDALHHLPRGPVREGDREDLAGRDAVIAHEVRDAVGEHARLAGAGASDDQHGALGGLDCPALLGVQLVEETLRHRGLQGTSDPPCRPRSNLAGNGAGAGGRGVVETAVAGAVGALGRRAVVGYRSQTCTAGERTSPVVARKM